MHAQPLAPRERLRRRCEVAEAVEGGEVLVAREEPRLEAAAEHEREDEAERLEVAAAADERQQVRDLERELSDKLAVLAAKEEQLKALKMRSLKNRLATTAPPTGVEAVD